MVSWRDKLQPGSFRGVPFQTDSVDSTEGRNVVKKSYLLTEDVSSRSVSRKPNEYKFDAFFLGEDYMEQRDNFRKALANPEPGTLIHPYYGTLQVIYETSTIRESSREGRMASISVTFVEAGVEKFPGISEDRKFKLNASIVSLEDVAQNAFNNNVVLKQVSDFVREGVTDKTNFLFSGMRDLIDAGAFVNSIGSELLNSTQYISDFASLRSTINQLIDPVPTLISSATAFSTLIRSAFGLINKTGSDGKSARTVIKKAREVEAVLEEGFTAQIAIKNDNQEVTERYVQVLGIANEAKAVPAMTFESRTDALEIRDDIVDQIDNLLETSKTDDEYQALKTLKSEVILYLPPEDLDLPQVRTIQVPDTLSSLIVSYNLYGSVDEEADIIKRNNIRHPAFIDPSKKLEVLVSG